MPGNACYRNFYAFRFAEHQAVPLRKIGKGIIPGWSSNPGLVASCVEANFGFHLRKDFDRPSTGAVNLVRLCTKRIFFKDLTLYRRNANSERAKNNRIFFRIISYKDRSPSSVSAADIPDEECYTFYESEYAAPDQNLEFFS